MECQALDICLSNGTSVDGSTGVDGSCGASIFGARPKLSWSDSVCSHLAEDRSDSDGFVCLWTFPGRDDV